MPELKKLKPISNVSKEQDYALRKIEKIEKPNLKEQKPIKKKDGIGSTSEKEQEIEDLLSEEEKLEDNYKRIEKQGMSDQGIVSPEELVEFGKDVYKGAKKGVKKVAGKVKEVVEKAKEKLK